MIIQIARFEIRYLLRNPLVWLTIAFASAVMFMSMNVDGFELGSEGGMFRNSAHAVLRNTVMMSILFMFVTTSFVANAVIRDDETGFGPILRSTKITKLQYLMGRFLGAFTVAAMCMLAVPLAMWIGSLMPWANPANLGPNHIADYLYAYFVIALPNLFIHGAIFFALATITRSMMATYLGVIGFMAGFLTLQEAFNGPQLGIAAAIAEPFAARALTDVARYWTIAERNVNLPSLSGAMLYNRLLWIGVASLCLAVTYAVYRFTDRGLSKRERKNLKLAQRASAAEGAAPAMSPALLPNPRHDSAALRALLWMRTKFELRQIVVSPAFPVLMAWGMYVTIFVLLTQRHPDFRPEYPTTLSLIPEIEDAFRMIPLIVAIYYAGELVWRERDRRVHELVDASPLPSWAYVIPKTAALAVLFVMMLVATVAASIGLQLSLGFTDVQLGHYVLWYVLPASFDSLLLAAVAIFVQALSPHKAIGWGVMVLFVAWQEVNQFIHHNLLNYAGKPDVPLSDLNGAGSFWIGAWTFRLYWGAFAALLLVIAYLLWRRGTEIRLKPRVVLGLRRLAGPPGWVAAAVLLTFLASGAYAYYNTNVIHRYQTNAEYEAFVAEFEKRYGKYHDIPQPSLEELTLDIAVYPQERRATTKGRFLLRNLNAQPIENLHVRLLIDGGSLELTNVVIPGARLIGDDAQYRYRIYRLARPMQPGDTVPLTFETQRRIRGFANEAQETAIVENGTFLTESDVMPILGWNGGGVLQDPKLRRKYGLPKLKEPAKLEELAATTRSSFAHAWTKKVDITLSTDADQTPLAPGRKISDATRDGRRTAQFVSTAPIRPRFSVQSARYAEKHRRHNGVDLAVYYHPGHAWNVDRMLDAMVASLDYYQANFGPYQFDHFRIVEFPGYREFAQAFAGTIPFSEFIGFTADYQQPDTIDYVSGITAHEFAHQYWPNQVIGAEMEGYTVFSEMLAQYSAHMVIKKMRGEDQTRRYLMYELDRYLKGRSWDSEDEPTLARVLGQDHIAYRKGAMAMVLLQKRIGEDGVNRALRSVIARYKFKGAPYPRSVDLIAAFRAEAKTEEEQTLITDLFERITLYDLKVTTPTATRRADGKWDVTVPIEAKKMYADPKGKETETQFAEHIEVGLFTAVPGVDAFSPANVLLMERHPIHSGHQVLKFVTDTKPLFAGVDPYNYYIDRDAGDNLAPMG